MKTQLRLFLFASLTLFLLEQCQPKSNSDNAVQVPTPPAPANIPVTKFDSIMQLLKSNDILSKADILELNVIDTNYSHKTTQSNFCDTSIQLNDSIFYAIICLTDEYLVCSLSFIVTIDEKNKKAIASQFLQPNCDVDFSLDSYKLYDYKIISNDSIQATKTTIFQKKDRDRTSPDEEKNIDHKEEQHRFFSITQTGQISSVK